MSLKDAVLEIAHVMAVEAERAGDSGLASYASQLRLVCKAVENGLHVSGPVVRKDALNDRDFIEAARGEFRGKVARIPDGAAGEPFELEAGYLAYIADGPEACVSVPLPPDMPVGARTNVGGYVYELRADGQLHHVP